MQTGDAFWQLLYDGVIAGIWVLHTGAKSGCKLVTLFGGYSYDGVSAGIWVIHTGAKSEYKLVTLFGGYSYVFSFQRFISKTRKTE